MPTPTRPTPAPATRSASPTSASAASRPAGAPERGPDRPPRHAPRVAGPCGQAVPARHSWKEHLVSNPVVSDLLGRSNRLGADPRNTNYAGGNTSATGTGTDPVTGSPVE